MLCNGYEEMPSKPKLDFRGNCRKTSNTVFSFYVRKFKSYQCFAIHMKWILVIGDNIDLICKIWANISKQLLKCVGYFSLIVCNVFTFLKIF